MATRPSVRLAIRVAVLLAIVAISFLGLTAGIIPTGRTSSPASAENTPTASTLQQNTRPTPDPQQTALAGNQNGIIRSPSPLAATPTPTPPTVFGLAWFHKPPQDGTTPGQLAAQNRYIHLTGQSDLAFRDKLRASGFTGPIYSYVLADGVEGPPPSSDNSECSYSRQPNDNNVAWSSGDFCNYLNAHESWFLHNSKGQRLADNYFDKGRWTYLMNPADPGWQQFSYQRLRQLRDNLGYDGIWLDNLDLDLQRMTTGVTNADGGVQEYTTDAAWQQAMRGWLAGLRAQMGDTPIWANLVGGGLSAQSWDPYALYLDGAMDESFAVQWVDNWREPQDWAAQLERADRWLSSGKGLVMVGQGEKDDQQRLRFTLASYMLVAQGEQAFFRYSRFDSFYSALWLYPEYDTARALGLPTGPRREVSPGLWRRDFTRGYVQVDLAGHTGQLTLTGR